MGVDFGEIIQRKNIKLEDLTGKIIAIDAYNALYQYLAAIRQPDGKLLMNKHGEITSHLSGLFYRTINLLEIGIKPVYVFDGKPPTLKEKEIEKRKKIKEESEKKYKEAIEKGFLEKAKTYAQATSKLSDEMVEDAKKLLEYMGIPYVQSPSEGEAQAAFIAKKGDAWAAASQDYDSLLYSAPRLIRNLTISGKRKIPRTDAYVEIKPEIIILDETLKNLKLNHEQLIELGILLGTDYNPDGFPGIGPKKALSLIGSYKNLRTILKILNIKDYEKYEEIKELFLKPNVTDNYILEWAKPNEEKIIEFLCDQKDFSIERIRNALERMKSSPIYKKQAGLEAWFG